jgi:MFS family permease
MWKMKIREALPSLFLLTNSLALFTLTWILITDVLGETSFYGTLLVSVSFYGSLVMSAAVGATFLYKKLRRKESLLSWVLLGTCMYLFSTILIAERELPNLVIMAFILGASVGVGIPACLAFFADYTKIENRGLIGATVFFAIQLLTALIYSPISELSINDKFLVLGVWRLLGVAGIFFYKPVEKLPEEYITHPFSSIISEKSFTFYFIPWFLFCLINFVEAPLFEQFFGSGLFGTYLIIEIIISSVSAFLGGILCDSKGRKTASIAGLVLLGISYAVLSFFPGMQFIQILFMLFEGTTWGILYVTFILVVWGDLSEGRVRERYYFIGSMPFLLSGLIEVFVQPFVKFISIYMSFSFASFFLFLAILPLLYAPETLPEKKIRERELKDYIEKAKKTREKYT